MAQPQLHAFSCASINRTTHYKKIMKRPGLEDGHDGVAM
jgi:hypothetical protein